MNGDFPKVKDRPTTGVPAIARADKTEHYQVIECPECGGEAWARPIEYEYSCRNCKVGADMLYEKANYGGRWEQVREWVLKRDKYRCQRCGACFKELHVHHKEKLVWFKSLKQANTPNNLITLCKGCHDEIEDPAPTNVYKPEIAFEGADLET